MFDPESQRSPALTTHLVVENFLALIVDYSRLSLLDHSPALRDWLLTCDCRCCCCCCCWPSAGGGIGRHCARLCESDRTKKQKRDEKETTPWRHTQKQNKLTKQKFPPTKQRTKTKINVLSRLMSEPRTTEREGSGTSRLLT